MHGYTMKNIGQNKASNRAAWRAKTGQIRLEDPSRLFLARLLLTLEDCRTTMAELVHAIGPLDQWVASDHDALLAE